VTYPRTGKEWREAARRALPRFVFEYVDGASEDELSLRNNRTAFEALTLRPRILSDTRRVDPSLTLLGQRWAQPFAVAPTGLNGLIRPGGDIALARAAARIGVPFILSTASNERLEAVRAAVPDANLWLQLYVLEDPGITEQLLQRARAAGIDTLVLTVDVPVSGLRERDVRNGFTLPWRVTPRLVMDLATHPRWALRQALTGQPSFVNLVASPDAALGPQAQAALLTRAMNRGLNWSWLARLRTEWAGKLALKGLLHPHDARLAVDSGIDALIVSNHGGRQLDGAVAPLAVLPEIVDAVAGRIPVVLDGGVRRGVDIVKALSLGAAAVLIGRPILYGLAAQGEAGAVHVLEGLRSELERCMILMGADAVAAVGRSNFQRRV